MIYYRPARIEFDIDNLGRILTFYARHLHEIDERHDIEIQDIWFDKIERKFVANCDVYKQMEH